MKKVKYTREKLLKLISLIKEKLNVKMVRLLSRM